MTMGWLRTSSGSPKLKDKAAGTRHLSGYALDLATRYNSGGERDARRLGIATLLHRLTQHFLNSARISLFCTTH